MAALPGIVERQPEVLYLVARRTGRRSPSAKESSYRLLLEHRAVDLGVTDHVEFDDRFLSVNEPAELFPPPTSSSRRTATRSRSPPER